MAVGDTTHTVVIERDQRGKYFLIGLGVILVALYWLFGGRFFQLSNVLTQFASAEGRQAAHAEGYKGVTSVVLPMFLEVLFTAVVFVGFSFTKAWAVIWDILSGIIDTAKTYIAVKSAERAAAGVATGTATGTAKKVAKISAEKLANAVMDMDSRLARIENAVFPPPPTAEELLEKVAAEKAALEIQVESLKSRIV